MTANENSAKDLNLNTLNLTRYPKKHAKELRAWDAADGYLLSVLAEQHPHQARFVIINDGFGALHRGIEELSNAQTNIIHINDSWCSQHATTLNAQSIELSLDLNELKSGTLGVAKIPKSLSLFEAQLIALKKQMFKNDIKNINIYFSGMQKHVSSGHLDIIKTQCREVEFLPTRKKARLYLGTLAAEQIETNIDTVEVDIHGIDLELKNVAGVFAQKKLDIGSRFFIEHFQHLPTSPEDRTMKVADVGCGNGFLSLAYKQFNPHADLYLFDESQAAVASAKLGFAHNYPENTPESLHIQHNDGLRDVTEKFDLILINPPFHQQNTVTTDIAVSMFKQAKHNLADGGELWIVANQHLEYQKPLKRLFRQTFEKFRNKKFVILLAKN